MKKHLFKVFLLGILAGIAISFGGAAYIACAYYGSRILGSILFSVGLLLVCGFGFKLYTGQIGKLFDNKKSFSLDLLVMYIGNFLGSIAVGLLTSLTITGGDMQNLVSSIGYSKLIDAGGGTVSWYSLLITSIFCGMLVYFAVEIYKKNTDNLTRVLGLGLGVSAFVVSGHAHCVANMYYLGASQLILTNPGFALLSILIAAVGNSIGAITLNTLFKYGFNESKNDKSLL